MLLVFFLFTVVEKKKAKYVILSLVDYILWHLLNDKKA